MRRDKRTLQELDHAGPRTTNRKTEGKPVRWEWWGGLPSAVGTYLCELVLFAAISTRSVTGP